MYCSRSFLLRIASTFVCLLLLCSLGVQAAVGPYGCAKNQQDSQDQPYEDAEEFESKTKEVESDDETTDLSFSIWHELLGPAKFYGFRGDVDAHLSMPVLSGVDSSRAPPRKSC